MVSTSTAEPLPLVKIDEITGRFVLAPGPHRLSQTIAELFATGQREYSSFIRRSVSLENIRVGPQRFEDLLRLLLEQANADYRKVGDIYYLFEVSQQDILKKLRTTHQVPLRYLSAEELPALFPAELASSRLYRVDRTANALILSGSAEEIEPIRQFISLIDRPLTGQEYYRFDLNHIKASEVGSLLPPALAYVDPIVPPGDSAIIVSLMTDRVEEFRRYLAMIDQPETSQLIRLRYIRSEDLLESLPPSVQREDVVQTLDLP